MSREIRIGRQRIIGVSDGEFVLPLEFLGAKAHRHLADASGVARLPIGTFLLPGEEPMLIDAGLGPDIPPYEGLITGQLVTELAAQSVRPEDIRHLALSHLHDDHIGWVATEADGLTFPNAQVYLGRGDWYHFVEGEAAALRPWVRSAFHELATSGRLTLLDGERELIRGVTAAPAPGHTPGHTVYVIHDGADRAIVLGDAVYCPAQLSELTWAAASEVDPALARSTREWLRHSSPMAGQRPSALISPVSDPASSSTATGHDSLERHTLMEYVSLGGTGLEVSGVALGCMTYGDPARGPHSWTLDEDTSRRFIERALNLGINFFDTANGYSDGSSEEILGRALKDFAVREEVVIATKVFAPMRSGPNSMGLSRKAIMTAVDESLRRLGTEYIDLYQIHRFDPRTPIEETLAALDDIVKAGKVRYLGASSMHAWQFAKALYLADVHGWTRFVSMQDHYNLLNREEEREMLPLCIDQGVGVIPWSPLARGRLTRDWGEQTARTKDDQFGDMLYRATQEADRAVVERVAKISEGRGVPRSQIALAWVASRPGITAPIVGATKPHHLDDAVAALEVVLTQEEVDFLEEPYVPHAIVGFE